MGCCRHQCDVCATVAGGLSDGVAHLAGRAVCHNPHGVNGFLCAPCADHNAAAVEVAALGEHPAEVFHQLGGLQHAAVADEPGGEPARAGSGNVDAAVAKGGGVLLDCWVLPHARVHRRCHHNRRGDREGRRRQDVVRQAQRELRHGVGRRWGDEQGVGAASQRNVFDGLRGVGVEEVCDDSAVSEASEGEGRHELRGALGEEDIDVRSGLCELAGEVSRLVGRDASCDAQDNVLTNQRVWHGPFLSGVRAGGPGSGGRASIPVHIVHQPEADEGEVRVDRVKHVRL